MTHVFGDGCDELGHFTFQTLNCLRIVSVHIVLHIPTKRIEKCLIYSRCVLTIDLVVRYTIVNKKNQTFLVNLISHVVSINPEKI